jgi:hypothetical protein
LERSTDETLLDEGAVLVVGPLVAGDGQDAAAVGQLAVAEGLEQRRHQLSPREVAGAAEEYEIEGHDVSCDAGWTPGVAAAAGRGLSLSSGGVTLFQE